MENDKTTPRLASIHKTALRCQIEGIGLTESALRRLVKSDELPCIMVGKKVLINWNALIHFLECGSDNKPAPYEHSIRRL